MAAPFALSPALTEGVNRVRGLLIDPTDAAIQAAFTPTFLAQIPPDKVKEVFGRAKSHLGTCKDQQVVMAASATTAVVKLSCDGGDENVSIKVMPDAPHLIDALLLKPAIP